MLRRNGSGRLGQQGRRYREDVNPMSGVANLVDAMLVLAVGIMLALIVSWNLNVAEGKVENRVKKEDAVTSFTEDDVSESTADSDNLEEQGTVYYDKSTGKYYVITSDGSTQGVE